MTTPIEPSDPPAPSEQRPPAPPAAPPLYWMVDRARVWQAPPEPLVGPLPLRTARWILLGALAFGVAFQLLFTSQLIGINVLLATLAALAISGFAAARHGVRVDRADLWLSPTALVFAALVALRSDSALIAFDLMAALATLVAQTSHSCVASPSVCSSPCRSFSSSGCSSPTPMRSSRRACRMRCAWRSAICRRGWPLP